jgi:ABC-type enterochelin transport system permease subunit
MFYMAKVLQALGLADIGYALFVGIMRNASMAEEIVLALIGIGVFSLGRVLERKAA